MPRRRQEGFTLVEVVVAFAIFALTMGAVYEAFAEAVQRSSQAHEREQSLLFAQSLLSQLRVSPAPWKTQESGTLEAGGSWLIETAPLDAAATDERSVWRAFTVTVHVIPYGRAGPRETVLRSIELAKVRRPREGLR